MKNITYTAVKHKFTDSCYMLQECTENKNKEPVTNLPGGHWFRALTVSFA